MIIALALPNKERSAQSPNYPVHDIAQVGNIAAPQGVPFHLVSTATPEGLL